MFSLFFAHKNMKKLLSNVAHNRPQFFFQYCQPAQNQPKSQFLFHKNCSPDDLCFFFWFVTEEILSITAGSDRGSYAKPLWLRCKRYHLTLTTLGYDFVLGEISFSILQMQRRLRPDSNRGRAISTSNALK